MKRKKKTNEPNIIVWKRLSACIIYTSGLQRRSGFYNNLISKRMKQPLIVLIADNAKFLYYYYYYYMYVKTICSPELNVYFFCTYTNREINRNTYIDTRWRQNQFQVILQDYKTVCNLT